MWRRLACAFFLVCLAGGLRGADWQATTWEGEPAYASESGGWRAVVSVARARLISFGPADRAVNLLLAPATRENRNRFGGHRLWLGPQSEWKNGWPPPSAWEYVEPASVAIEAGALRLAMPATGDEWPQLTRTYHWAGASLVCGAEFSGGTRPAQFVHILQVPAATVVTAEAQPEEKFPAGYVKLATYAAPFAARFEPPPQVTRADRLLTLQYTGKIAKFGFRPQSLTGRIPGYELRVSRGALKGETAGEAAAGFSTQVFFSDVSEELVELEQLSPLLTPGHPARFEMVLAGRRL